MISMGLARQSSVSRRLSNFSNCGQESRLALPALSRVQAFASSRGLTVTTVPQDLPDVLFYQCQVCLFFIAEVV